MSDPERLRQCLTEDLADCVEGDVDRRIERLAASAERVPDHTEGDLRALSALGDATRHRLARLLVAADDERCVCELTALVDVSESAVSHALGDLVDAGLAERRVDGRWRHYCATERAVALVEALDATRETVEVRA